MLRTSQHTLDYFLCV